MWISSYGLTSITQKSKFSMIKLSIRLKRWGCYCMTVTVWFSSKEKTNSLIYALNKQKPNMVDSNLQQKINVWFLSLDRHRENYIWKNHAMYCHPNQNSCIIHIWIVLYDFIFLFSGVWIIPCILWYWTEECTAVWEIFTRKPKKSGM